MQLVFYLTIFITPCMSYLLYLIFRCDRRCDGCDGKFRNFVGTKHTLCFICPQLAQFVLCTRLVPAQTLKLFYTWSIFFPSVILPKEHTPRMIKNNVGFHTTPPIGTYAVGICCIRIMKIKPPIFHSDPQHFVVVNFQPWHSWGAKKKP